MRVFACKGNECERRIQWLVHDRYCLETAHPLCEDCVIESVSVVLEASLGG
jgi:hypothetical protein